MRWRAFQSVIFDCDSTLSQIEGIDILANKNQRREIAELTDAAMDGHVSLEEVYGKRLEIINPTENQIFNLRSAYKTNVVPGAKELIDCLKDLDIEVAVVSGGLEIPVIEFATWLGIETNRVRAVGSYFDPMADWGNGSAAYLDYKKDEMTISDGKKIAIESMGLPGRKLLIGDGQSDLLAGEAVDLFVGYTGVVEREKVLKASDVVISSLDLSSLLALVVGPARLSELLISKHELVAKNAIQQIEQGHLSFNHEELEAHFQRCLASSGLF